MTPLQNQRAHEQLPAVLVVAEHDRNCDVKWPR